MKKRYFNVAILLLVLAMSVVLFDACAPARVFEPAIPAHFTTYTSEGLFSISYPPDWVPAISKIEDRLEETKELLKTTDPEVSLEEASFLFFGGIPIEGEYYNPNVNIMIVPRSIGYWTLDEIVEVESQYRREHTQRYREYSQVRTVVDGREAAIIDSEAYFSDLGMNHYLQLSTVKDKFLWTVTCTTEPEDFKDYEDTFYSIVRSLRILD